MPEQIIPNITQPLLKRLDELYPEACPDPADSVPEMWMKAGERRLVRHLHQNYAWAQES